jgi:dTMP kinase
MSKMTKGKFISIEGVEGAGKSTVVDYVKKYLIEANINVVCTREPGGTALAEEMRKLILHPSIDEKIEAETELLLMFAGRAQHIKNIILPALNAGKWLVCDRYIDASYAYQGGGRNIDKNAIVMLDKWIVNSIYPDLTLLLDIDPQQGFERTQKRGGAKDRIEQEKLDFFARVRDAYLQRAKQDSQRIKIIDASLSLQAVQQQIQNVLNIFIRDKK